MNLVSLKRLLIISGLLLSISLIAGFWLYNQVYAPNIKLSGAKKYLYIYDNDDYEDLLNQLDSMKVLESKSSFNWTAHKMKLPILLKPGKYELINDMSNRDLINRLRLGEQVPVNLVLKSVRNKEQLAALVSNYIEPDSTDLITLLNDESFINSLGYNSETIMAMFIPNTYQFRWNTSKTDFFKRMKKENEKFWSDEKLKKAEQIGLNKIQVSVLASIVEKETSKDDEKAKVAGVYMNRFNKGMRLQADPTLIFALNNFQIRRVLNKHKEIDSPYNTYLYAGLPPGPICAPSISSINSVLNFEKHDYLFFCAKSDFSGYHEFAKTYSEHINNAKKFQRELDKRDIRS